jgi:cyclopropane fatty-acyl-phospholipid synthase-like methyltransferase
MPLPLVLLAVQRYGVQVMGIALSKSQHAYGNHLIDAKGLRGKVQRDFCESNAKIEYYFSRCHYGLRPND